MAGWKRVAVNWDISPNTPYWLAVQLDNTATTTEIDYSIINGLGTDFISFSTSLPNPFGGGLISSANGMTAIYAVWGTGGPIGLKSVNAVTKANIKSINAVLIANVKSINAIA